MDIFEMISHQVSTFLETIRNINLSETTGDVLLLVDALCSALFTEMLFKDNEEDKRKIIIHTGPRAYLKSLMKFLVASFFFLLLNVGITLVIFAVWLQFAPQEENFVALLVKIFKAYHIKFLIPLIATIFAGIALKGMTWKMRGAKLLLCMLLIVAVLASSLTFLWDSVRIVQRPHYNPPVESVSAMIHSRLERYPFAITGEQLRKIGDGETLIVAENTEGDRLGGNDSEGELPPVNINEPYDFRSYINAVIENRNVEEYLSRAYQLYREGRHDNNFYYIGIMWYYLADYTYLISEVEEITREQCYENALEAYRRSLEEEESSNVYTAMAIIYRSQGKREQERVCIENALAVEENAGSDIEVIHDILYTWYLEDIYNWVDSEENLFLMENAKTVLEYTNDLSMYILYGACAIAENQDVEGAYDALCRADEYYLGKSTMVKILRCICADLLSRNDTEQLYAIYQMEHSAKLSGTEELYLIRYLFASGRYEELWGYIDDVGTADGDFSVEKAVIKAGWYFEGKDEAYADPEDMKMLLQCIDNELDGDRYQEEEKNLLLLSRSLLRSRLEETADIDYEQYHEEQVSDVGCVFEATSAFNHGNYDEAIRYCDIFFAADADNTEEGTGVAEPEESGGKIRISMQELTSQERMVLRYHMQLILAHAHFEYAKGCWKGSEEWQLHMDAAEKECEAFEQSSKSLFYIGERFEELREIIRQEKGIMPEEEEDKLLFEKKDL